MCTKSGLANHFGTRGHRPTRIRSRLPLPGLSSRTLVPIFLTIQRYGFFFRFRWKLRLCSGPSRPVTPPTAGRSCVVPCWPWAWPLRGRWACWRTPRRGCETFLLAAATVAVANRMREAAASRCASFPNTLRAGGPRPAQNPGCGTPRSTPVPGLACAGRHAPNTPACRTRSRTPAHAHSNKNGPCCGTILFQPLTCPRKIQVQAQWRLAWQGPGKTPLQLRITLPFAWPAEPSPSLQSSVAAQPRSPAR